MGAAENGVSEKQLMTMLGWTDPKYAAHFTKKASVKKLTYDAMQLMIPKQIEGESIPLLVMPLPSETKKEKKSVKIQHQRKRALSEESLL